MKCVDIGMDSYRWVWIVMVRVTIRVTIRVSVRVSVRVRVI